MALEFFMRGPKKYHRIYRTWTNMKNRCNNNKYPGYKNYGGKGIIVCREWYTYKNFELWAMNNGYKEGLSIERKDNSKGYNPENCTWIEIKNQSKNRTVCNYIEHNGRKLLLSEWSKLLGIKRSTLAQRLYVYKWPVREVLSN